MTEATKKRINPKTILVEKASEAIAKKLPVEPEKLKKVGSLINPTNIKRAVVIAAVGGVAISLLSKACEKQMYRAAVASELKKQLEPLNKKIDYLTEQNEYLQMQNEQLREELESME